MVKKRGACYPVTCRTIQFHADDCGGCPEFLDCARREEDFDAECICWNCFWLGYWEDCGAKVIPQTMQDPEERYALCPHCGHEVEDTQP